MESVLVGTAYVEDRRPECLQGGPILQDQVNVVAEEADQAKCKHDRDNEQEQQVELASVVSQLALKRDGLM